MLLVPDWAAGNDVGESGQDVAAHVEECRECSELAETYRMLRKVLALESDPEHASTEDIVRAAYARGPVTSTVRDHIAACDECSRLVHAVQQAERESHTATGLSRWQPWRILSLLAASLLLFAAGIVTSQQLRSPQDVDRPSELANALVVPEVQRGEAAGSVPVIAATSQTALILQLPAGIEWTASRKPVVRIVRGDGKIVDSIVTRSVPTGGSIALLLNGATLGTGNYRLQLLIDGESTPVAEYALRVDVQ